MNLSKASQAVNYDPNKRPKKFEEMRLGNINGDNPTKEKSDDNEAPLCLYDLYK